MGYIKKTLSDYSKVNTLRLHMPGHKGKINPLDLTELPQTDDLNSPSGSYAEAIDFLTRTYKSKKSFFITNGATLGIQVAVLYAKKMGYKIIALRNSHMSVINACLLFDLDCVILDPEFDYKLQTFKGASDVLISYLENTDEKCAVFITSTDYYGRCEDVERLAQAVSKKNALLVCDEAHGSHFVFSKELPRNASNYADIWINGAHKTLGALTQGAFLHCGENIDLNVFEGIFHALNTSSPSHIIAASLEEAVQDSLDGRWDKKAQECAALTTKINELNFIKCADNEWAKSAGYVDKDATRVVIDAKYSGGGYYIYDKLYREFNIQLEMADFRYAVAIMTIYDDDDCIERLFEAIKSIDEKINSEVIIDMPQSGKRIIGLSEEWLSNSRAVSMHEAEGKVSACILGPYPPGTALILPGEKITHEHILLFKRIEELGGHVFGKRNGKVIITDV